MSLRNLLICLLIFHLSRGEPKPKPQYGPLAQGYVPYNDFYIPQEAYNIFNSYVQSLRTAFSDLPVQQNYGLGGFGGQRSVLPSFQPQGHFSPIQSPPSFILKPPISSIPQRPTFLVDHDVSSSSSSSSNPDSSLPNTSESSLQKNRQTSEQVSPSVVMSSDRSSPASRDKLPERDVKRIGKIENTSEGSRKVEFQASEPSENFVKELRPQFGRSEGSSPSIMPSTSSSTPTPTTPSTTASTVPLTTRRTNKRPTQAPSTHARTQQTPRVEFQPIQGPFPDPEESDSQDEHAEMPDISSKKFIQEKQEFRDLPVVAVSNFGDKIVIPQQEGKNAQGGGRDPLVVSVAQQRVMSGSNSDDQKPIRSSSSLPEARPPPSPPTAPPTIAQIWTSSTPKATTSQTPRREPTLAQNGSGDPKSGSLDGLQDRPQITPMSLDSMRADLFEKMRLLMPPHLQDQFLELEKKTRQEMGLDVDTTPRPLWTTFLPMNMKNLEPSVPAGDKNQLRGPSSEVTATQKPEPKTEEVNLDHFEIELATVPTSRRGFWPSTSKKVEATRPTSQSTSSSTTPRPSTRPPTTTEAPTRLTTTPTRPTTTPTRPTTTQRLTTRPTEAPRTSFAPQNQLQQFSETFRNSAQAQVHAGLPYPFYEISKIIGFLPSGLPIFEVPHKNEKLNTPPKVQGLENQERKILEPPRQVLLEAQNESLEKHEPSEESKQELVQNSGFSSGLGPKAGSQPDPVRLPSFSSHEESQKLSQVQQNIAEIRPETVPASPQPSLQEKLEKMLEKVEKSSQQQDAVVTQDQALEMLKQMEKILTSDGQEAQKSEPRQDRPILETLESQQGGIGQLTTSQGPLEISQKTIGLSSGSFSTLSQPAERLEALQKPSELQQGQENFLRKPQHGQELQKNAFFNPQGHPEAQEIPQKAHQPLQIQENLHLQPQKSNQTPQEAFDIPLQDPRNQLAPKVIIPDSAALTTTPRQSLSTTTRRPPPQVKTGAELLNFYDELIHAQFHKLPIELHSHLGEAVPISKISTENLPSGVYEVKEMPTTGVSVTTRAPANLEKEPLGSLNAQKTPENNQASRPEAQESLDGHILTSEGVNKTRFGVRKEVDDPEKVLIHDQNPIDSIKEAFGSQKSSVPEQKWVVEGQKLDFEGQKSTNHEQNWSENDPKTAHTPPERLRSHFEAMKPQDSTQKWPENQENRHQTPSEGFQNRPEGQKTLDFGQNLFENNPKPVENGQNTPPESQNLNQEPQKSNFEPKSKNFESRMPSIRPTDAGIMALHPSNWQDGEPWRSTPPRNPSEGSEEHSEGFGRGQEAQGWPKETHKKTPEPVRAFPENDQPQEMPRNVPHQRFKFVTKQPMVQDEPKSELQTTRTPHEPQEPTQKRLKTFMHMKFAMPGPAPLAEPPTFDRQPFRLSETSQEPITTFQRPFESPIEASEAFQRPNFGSLTPQNEAQLSENINFEPTKSSDDQKPIWEPPRARELSPEDSSLGETFKKYIIAAQIQGAPIHPDLSPILLDRLENLMDSKSTESGRRSISRARAHAGVVDKRMWNAVNNRTMPKYVDSEAENSASSQKGPSETSGPNASILIPLKELVPLMKKLVESAKSSAQVDSQERDEKSKKAELREAFMVRERAELREKNLEKAKIHGVALKTQPVFQNGHIFGVKTYGRGEGETIDGTEMEDKKKMKSEQKMRLRQEQMELTEKWKQSSKVIEKSAAMKSSFWPRYDQKYLRQLSQSGLVVKKDAPLDESNKIRSSREVQAITELPIIKKSSEIRRKNPSTIRPLDPELLSSSKLPHAYKNQLMDLYKKGTDEQRKAVMRIFKKFSKGGIMVQPRSSSLSRSQESPSSSISGEAKPKNKVRKVKKNRSRKNAEEGGHEGHIHNQKQHKRQKQMHILERKLNIKKIRAEATTSEPRIISRTYGRDSMSLEHTSTSSRSHQNSVKKPLAESLPMPSLFTTTHRYRKRKLAKENLPQAKQQKVRYEHMKHQDTDAILKHILEDSNLKLKLRS